MCMSLLPECSQTDPDPFVLSEAHLDYFNVGWWVMGNRTFLVNFQQRPFKDAEKACKDIGVSLLETPGGEKELIPSIKHWTREFTNIHLWTGLKYNTTSGQFLNSKNEPVKISSRTKFIESKLRTKRSTKLDTTFCVAMSISFEFRTQSPCPDGTSSACSWSFLDYYAANCNNHIGTICQHHDKTNRTIQWKSSYENNVEEALKDTALTSEFGYVGNTNLLRSKYKQPFGVLICPNGYRMARATNSNLQSFTPPDGLNSNDVYTYDKQETFWVVDSEEFDKGKDSMCTISKHPKSGKNRELSKVKCTDHNFYLCEKIAGVSKPSNLVVTESPKPLWREGPQGRTYPLLDTTNSNPKSDGNCTIESMQRLQVAFVLDTTKSMEKKFPTFIEKSKAIMRNLADKFPNASFALTTNSNWDKSCFKGAGGHDNKVDGCYKPIVNFTHDPEEFARKAKNIPAQGGITDDNAVHGAAFTAADNTLGWNRKDKDESGVNLWKVLIVITDAKSRTHLDKPGNRKRFRGDGSDTCETSLPVNIAELRKVMNKKAMHVIGFYETDNIALEYDTKWFSLAEVKYCADTWKGNFNNIVPVVQRCIGNLLESCVYQDPIGYNTLGF